MFTKKHQGYAYIALLLIGWLVLIDSRNVNNPRVQRVTVEPAGNRNVVKCEVWNPRYEEVYVQVLMRLVDGGYPGSGRPPTASPYHVVEACIGPRSSLPLRELIQSVGNWREAEVRVFVINDPAEIARIDSGYPLKKVAAE